MHTTPATPATAESLGQGPDDLSVLVPPPKMDWGNLFYSQLQLMPPASPSVAASAPTPLATYGASTPLVTKSEPAAPSVDISMHTAPAIPAKAPAKQGPKRRKRKPRKKIVQEVKEYVIPTERGVLLGRGGMSFNSSFSHCGTRRTGCGEQGKKI